MVLCVFMYFIYYRNKNLFTSIIISWQNDYFLIFIKIFIKTFNDDTHHLDLVPEDA